ncbi:MAG: threonine ammonia-lyase [Rhodospirillaceae bacterium]
MTAAAPASPLSLAEIEAAADRIAGAVAETPILENPLVNAQLGGRLLLKAECLQRTGSFKIRGATNFLAAMDPTERARGVVTHSSGNHGQAVACAAHRFNVPAYVVVPRDAPALKVRLTEAWGAKVIRCERSDRESTAQQIAQETAATLLPPYDHPAVMAGQGTTGLEIVAQLKAEAVVPDRVLVCCGGGGLTAGISTVIRATWPDVPVYAVEPEGWDDTGRSLESGQRVANSPGADPLCDALLAPMPGVLTFEVNRTTLAGGVVVSRSEVLGAMASGFVDYKVVLEPGGAVALAAALAGRAGTGGVTVAVLSGGNVEPATFVQAFDP